RFEQAIMLVLIGLIMAVTVSATAHLVVAVWHLLSSSAVDPTDQRVFQTVFGAVFTVLIALLAIARKFILLDLQTIAPMDVLSLAAAVLALGIVYWLVRDQDARIRQQDASLRKDVPDAQ
ncbi:phosphate-starvation-inducible PsiE family protein, partial [Acetobacter tropicalis]